MAYAVLLSYMLLLAPVAYMLTTTAVATAQYTKLRLRFDNTVVADFI